MADKQESSEAARNEAPQPRRDAREEDSTRDPEFEMPDPEQIERDIEQAERIFGRSRSAIDKPDKAA